WISQPGVYTVTLISGNSSLGLYDTITKEDHITVLPSVNMCGPGNFVTDTLRGTTGFLYDDGGPGAQYNPNRNCSVVIKPPCADSITLTFKSFDVSIYT